MLLKLDTDQLQNSVETDCIFDSINDIQHGYSKQNICYDYV